MITEDQLKQLAIQWFQDTGWNYVHGAVLAPEGVAAEREDFRAVVLKGRLADVARRLNPKLIQMAKDMQEAMKRHEELGLNPEEEAFYDALADRREVLLSMGDATSKKLASELTEKLRNSTTVDCLRASR
ncbi:MAG: type I restriction enzyme endonuclease domain-containing protein [Verrucomicrobiota bacterium]